MKEERKLKILVVHEISYVEKVIYEIHEFPELLAEAGHDVHFLEFAEGYAGRPGQNPRHWKQRGRVYKDSELTLHSPWLSGVFAIDRLIALVTVFAVLWRLRREKFDVILNFAVPTYGLQVLLFGWLTGTPIVHRALDVSHKIRESLWNPFISVVEWIVFNLVTLRSANNPAMADYIKSRLMDKDKKIVVHYPPSLSPGMEPAPYDSELALSLGVMPHHKVIAYLGSFFYFSGLNYVVNDFAAASHENPDLRLLLIGGGEQEEELRLLAKQSIHPERIVFSGFIPFDQIPRYFSLVDVAINDAIESVKTLAPANEVRYMGVVEIAEHLQLPVKPQNRIALGKFVKSLCGDLAKQESRLCNGRTISICCYPFPNADVEKAVSTFFN
jgi:glycosyltransferase involved in cell wall biosynthesis